MTVFRSLYYKGKRLCSEDFTREQNYMRHGFQSMRQAAFGMGVIEGLHLKKQKNTMFILEQGSACDEDGNIICVDKDADFDIRELPGFHELKQSFGYLNLQYQEVRVKNEEGEFFQIQEGYRLYLSSRPSNSNDLDFGFHREVLYEDEDCRLEFEFPAFLPLSGKVKGTLRLYRSTCCSVNASMCFHGNHWMLEADDEMMQILFHDGKKDIQEQVYTFVRRKNTKGKRAMLQLHHIELVKDSAIQKPKDVNFRIEMFADLDQKLKEVLYQKKRKKNQGLQLGIITFHSKEEPIIEKLESCPSHYSCRPVLLDQKQVLLQRYGYEKEMEKPQEMTVPKKTSGLVTMMLEEDQTLYISEEYSHGLGLGNVYMQAAFTSLPFLNTHKDQKETVFGNAALFEGEEGRYEAAVRVRQDSGTFQIAAKLPVHHALSSLHIVWYASCYPPLEDNRELPQLLRLEPSAIELTPFSSCTFTPIFLNESMLQDVEYEILDAHGGEIDNEGNYYAPYEEGIYQLMASCQGDRVYAYVKVVKADEEP